MYFKRFLEYLTECEIICNEEKIKLHSIHPYEIISDKTKVINEAILSNDKIKEFTIKVINAFYKLCNQFQEVAAKLKTKNADWFNKISHFDLNNKDLSKFEYEIYDYQQGLSKLTHTQIPKFDQNSINDLLGDGKEFKVKAFGEFFTKDSEGNEDFNPAYFRGSKEKIKVTGVNAKSLFTFAVNWLKNYETAVVRPIMVENSEIRNITMQSLEINTIVTESTLLAESWFKDEYYDIILEDGVEPTDIKKEEKENNINTNTEENKENKHINELKDAVQKYFKICSTVQTMKMKIAEEAYKDLTDFIDKVMNL